MVRVMIAAMSAPAAMAMRLPGVTAAISAVLPAVRLRAEKAAEPHPRRRAALHFSNVPGSGPGGPRGDRPRFEGGPRGDNRGPRREGGFQGGERRDFRGPPREPVGPYISPFFSVTFYPEDNSFKDLADAIRKSCRTLELF